MRFRVNAVGQVAFPNTSPIPFDFGGEFASISIAMEQLVLEIDRVFKKVDLGKDPFRFCLFTSFHCEPLAELHDSTTPIYVDTGVDGVRAVRHPGSRFRRKHSKRPA